MMSVIVHCDGACLGNPGKGGWGAVINDHEISGNNPTTTNNRMELTAAIESIKYINTMFSECSDITIISDSSYVVKGITEWLPKWKLNGWRATKGPVLNDDLWKELDMLNKDCIKWQWVKGHSGNKLNDRADALATISARLCE